MNYDCNNDPEKALLAIIVRKEEKNMASVEEGMGSMSQKEREKRDEKNVFGK